MSQNFYKYFDRCIAKKSLHLELRGFMNISVTIFLFQFHLTVFGKVTMEMVKLFFTLK